MKQFFTTVGQAIYGRDYKAQFASKTFWQGFRYVSMLVAMQIIIVSAVVGIRDIAPFVAQFFDRSVVVQMIKAYVPADAQVNIKDGVVSTSDGLPVIIQLDEAQRESLVQNENTPDIENILVVDPAITDKQVEKFKEYKTAVLVTSTQLISYKDDGTSIEIMSLQDIKKLEINRASITSFYEQALPYVKWGIVILVPILLIVFYGMAMIGQLIFSLILAGLVLLIAKMKQVQLSYKQAYSISLYAITLPIIIDTIINLFVVQDLGFLWSVLVVAVLVWVNMKSEKGM